MALPDVTPLKVLLQNSASVACFLPKNPSYDSVSSALALKLCLEESGKTVKVICPDPIIVEFNRLVGIDTIVNQFGGRNLIISFPRQTEYVDKVSYHLEEGELRLIVSSKPGMPPLDHTQLKFISAGQVDAFVMIDVEQLSDLAHIYQSGRDIFQSLPHKTVSISRNLPASSYSPHQLFNPEVLSVAEVMTSIIESLELPLSQDAATNLLSAIEKVTDHFRHPHTTHHTFETAAKLMKSGARRHDDVISAADYPAGSIPTAVPGTSENIQETKVTPPDDWLAPKVYRGPMLQ